MGEWKECKLGEIADVTKLAGFEFTKYINYNNYGEIIALRALNISKGYLCLSDIKRIDKKVSDALQRSKLFKGDIVITYTGNGYGDAAFIAENDKYHLAPNIAKITAKSTMDAYFLFRYIKSSMFYNQLENFLVGSSQPTIPMNAIRLLTVPTPPLPEQRAIAEILSSLDDKIDLLNRQNKTLEDLAQTYFRQWFIEGGHEEFISVSDIAKLDNEGVNPSKNPLELFYHYSIPAFDNEQQPIQELGKAILSNKFKVKPKSILVSKLNPTTPRIWIIGNNVLDNSVCSTEFQVLKPVDNKYQLFLYFLMKSYNVVSYFSMCTTGTSGSHQRIKPEYILQVEIGKPDDQKLKEYNDMFDDLMVKVQKNMDQIRTLQKLRDTLLPKLVSGEVRVKGI